MSRQSYTKNIQNLNEVNWSNLSKLISGTVIKQFLLNWLDSVANGLLSDGETTIEQAITALQNASGSGGDTFFKGYYATEATLNAVYETGSNGYYAIVGETDTFWVWDSDSNMWVDSGSKSSNGSQERFSLIGHTSIPTAFSAAASIIGVPKFTNLTAVKLVNSGDASEISIVSDSTVADLPITVAAGDYTYELTYETGYEQGVLLINFS
jgi:hypothetical protein